MPLTHEMTLTETHEGTDTWVCPVCGRVLLIELDPWRRVVDVPGDECAVHVGSTGGLRMNKMEASQE